MSRLTAADRGSLQQAVLEDALTAQALADLPEEGEDRAVLGALPLGEHQDEGDARVDLAEPQG